MRLPEDPDLPPQINIVPMIDVVFAILTFFIVSSLFLTRSQGLPVNLPNAATGQAQAESQVVVTIDRSGTLSLNRQPTELQGLEAAVRQLVASGQQPLVIINADTEVPHGQVVAVMDRLRAVPGVRMAIATQRP